ncbi:ligase-associated DNA damage response endonuclease PdeM [Allosediminivita pacifica]|uniref:Putative phosphoesterase n=1 Tax=Allosediminivita pacifica TaxID=1267769 RepID=A0A2T6BA07_9RHOB|nr:ligase-associated DNA damage response endonuclease PdeM [Allosediminivita pacifica]PTX52862.1 putative phosphoesterase [Allosediminivita pacifica]GGA95214.1 metallophosphoesterase [Allosediminivita pacifica]
MNTHGFTFHGARLAALPSGALHWSDEDMLVVSDLHLGKAARLSSQGGAQLPPYEAQETLSRLEADLAATGARRVICLGDSFDTLEIAAGFPEAEAARITAMQAGRDWTWIEGNHDPGPLELGGTHLREARIDPLVFRHIASDDSAEVSGHYHPKARLIARGRSLSRPCFLVDSRKLVMPSYGSFTGGLRTDSPTLSTLMGEDAQAILTGARPVAIPMPRRTTA